MENEKIRPYDSGDWERLCAIHDGARQIELTLAGLPDAFVPLRVAAEREGLFSYQVAVGEAGGQAVAFVAYDAHELAWLYVDPACMRRGWGRRLAAYAIDRSERPLNVEVLAGNGPALALYQSLGFRLVETASGRMPGNERFPVTVNCLTLD